MAPSKKHDTLGALIKQRSNTIASIVRIKDMVQDHEHVWSAEELDCRLEIVETYFTQALEYQSSIEECNDGVANANAADVRAELEDLYCEVKVRIRTLMKTEAKTKEVRKPEESIEHKPIDNLPKLTLPKFSGKYTEFPNFIRLFKTLVHEERRLSKIEKFNHLISCLSGIALRTVKALDFVDENYDLAISLLENRFNNKYLMCKEHVNELFNLRKIQKGSADQLLCLIDTVTANFNSLSSLLDFEEIANVFIVHLVVSALDTESQAKVEEAIDCSKTFSWAQCLKILNQRCQTLEAHASNSNNTKNMDLPQLRPPSNKMFNKNSKAVALHSNSAVNSSCICRQQGVNHPLWKCNKFLELSPEQRFDHVKKSALCINCLSPQHSVRQCKSSGCKKCNSLHHTLLHRNNATTQSQSSQSSGSQQWHNALPFSPTGNLNTHQQSSLSNHTNELHQQQQRIEPHNWNSASSSQPLSLDKRAASATTTMVGQQIETLNSETENNQTILATAIVVITDKYGNKQFVRALLDSASQLNFMTQDCAQRLNLKKNKVTTVIGGIGQAQTQAKFATTACISARKSQFETSLQFLILPSITGQQPPCKINTNAFNIPQDVELADPQFNVPQRIDLLIGADLFFELFDGNHIKLGNNCPTLIHTVFGWVVSGRCKTAQGAHSLVANIKIAEPDENLEELVKQFWSMEKLPDAKPKWSKEQQECDDHFIKTVNRDQSGRYELQLPFKANPAVLGDSKQMAVRRFLSLEKRLNANASLKQAYGNFIADYETQGHMTKINWPASLNGYYIMPHHCVLRPDKTTTKLRVVFDASAKAANNIALNDILKVGPVVQNELITILWNFRCHRFGIMADVVAMYRQIMINTNDRQVQNIVWRNDKTDSLNLYQLNTVTYGTAAAPYLATRCLVHLADENMEANPKAAEIMKNDFYVDDLITGGESLEEIKTIKQDIEKIMQQAGFTLHKWFSNNNEFVSDLSNDEREKMISINDMNVVKTLGVIWDAGSDTFKFNYKITAENDVITKRKVLAEMSKLFDPLGLIKPIIVKAKIFLQELWLKGLDWDEPIPDECSHAWKRYISQLANLNNIQVPRYVLLIKAEIQMHGFSDASIRAYGACFYVRCVDAHGNIKVTLLTSRSKVAPISTVRSLPCLELCGAHLMAQLFLKVRTISNFNNVFFWTDSVIVLAWLAEHATNLNTFVANRVSFIQEHTADLPWRYVPSSLNPADLLSRGATVDELSASIWFTGPEFLTMPMKQWPQHPKQRLTESLPERKVIKSVLLATTNDFLEFVNYGSDFIKTCNIVAFVRRFIRNCRSKAERLKSRSKLISASEFNDAFNNIIVVIQSQYFSSELEMLNNDKNVLQQSVLKALNPFVEKQGNFRLLKVGGRLKHADLPYVTKCPVILPKNCPFVLTYVQHLHKKHLHAGAQALMTLIQQQFWIVGAREYARKVVRKCILCFKYRPRMVSQIMGNLPEHRISPVKPFSHCGIDFCGPIVTTVRIRSTPKYKTYIAVFVCFVTRAVHLEVVSALTTEAFIAALKRFIARRGLCTTLYCDNATNFVGARNHLQELKRKFTAEHFVREVTGWCNSEQIEFKHIPPRSPHFGGIWEAAVKSAKTLLYKLMQSVVFTFEELSTATAQIEAVLNSRPLTAISADPSDERVLTPAHFLNQSRAECIAEPTITTNKISILKTWQQITVIQQHFWKRWSKEYLLQLQQRNKWTTDKNNVEVGALVMVHEDNTPPQKWIIGRITNTIAGTDGKVRVADIKTPAGVLRRAVTKLAVIPLEDSN